MRPLKSLLIIGLSTYFGLTPLSFAEELTSEPLGMVSSEHALASQAGIDILQHGGNAFDAIVATAYALAVVDPCCGNLGGGGFITLVTAEGETQFLDFREVAPAATGPDTYTELNDIASTSGYAAVGVPGTVKGLNAVLERYGSLPLETVIAPAITLAEEGFLLDEHLLFGYQENANRVLRQNAETRKIFFHPLGTHLQPKDIFKQTDLANTLKNIQENGNDGFYSGEVGDAIVTAMQENGGFITADDLLNYEPRWRDPYTCDYHAYTVITSPPPGSGAAICEMLTFAQFAEENPIISRSFEDVFLTGHAMAQAISDRNQWLADPDFIDVDTAPMQDTERLQALFKSWQQALEHPDLVLADLLESPAESKNTTHISVIDAKGNTASLTFTLNGHFGAGVIPPGTGVLLNNEMDDFTTILDRPNMFGLIQGEQNQVEGGKRPLSSMSPTVLLKKTDNERVAIGTPGGSTISTQIFLVLKTWLEQDISIAQAVITPRYHQQAIDSITMEADAFSNEVIAQLLKRDFTVNDTKAIGRVNAVILTQDQQFEGIADPRNASGAVIMAWPLE